MKNLIYSGIATLLLSLAGFAQQQSVKEFHVIFADWTEWGRTSKNCKGFGLCNFQSCTFCCTENGVIVECNNKNRVPNSGVIEIDKVTNEGFLTISLDVAFKEQNDAVKNTETLYLDEDLHSGNITLYKGEYKFNNSVGRYGGYLIKASLK
jgi:hypothetical protein